MEPNEAMNLIDVISRNHFLKEIFPEGLQASVLIGQIGFDLGSRFSLNIHTKQRPAKEIVKWGTWKKDYDTVVLCLLGQLVGDIVISNWGQVDYAQLICEQIGDRHLIRTRNEGWEVQLSFGSLVFQECRTYIG
jgi:hypothetical protein